MCKHGESSRRQTTVNSRPKPADKHKFRRQFAPEIRADQSPNSDGLRLPGTPVVLPSWPYERASEEIRSPTSPHALVPPLARKRLAWARAATEDVICCSPCSPCALSPAPPSPSPRSSPSPHSRSPQAAKLSPLKTRALSVDTCFVSSFVRVHTPSSDGESRHDPLTVTEVSSQESRGQDLQDSIRRRSQHLRSRLQKAVALQRLCDEEGIPNDFAVKAPAARRARRARSTFHFTIDGRPVSQGEREQWDAAFAKFASDGEIHVDDLRRALQLCGFCDVREAALQEALKDCTAYNTLDKGEFESFVCRFDCGLHGTYKMEFGQLDPCSAGTIDAGQLEHLLKRIGQPVRRFVLDELVSEVNGDGYGHVDFDGFLKVRHLIKKREGFAARELDLFSQVFEHFDREKTGFISQEEFANALAWLGFPDSFAELHVERRDGRLSENEFLRCLWKVHSHETALVERFFESRDALGGRSAINKQLRSGEELVTLIHGLGYSPSPQAVLNAMAQTGLLVDCSLEAATAQAFLRSVPLDIGVDEVCRLLSSLRSCDGFTDSEMRNLREAFSFYAKSKKDAIWAPTVCKALRWLGHPLPLDDVLRLIGEVDVDGTDMLDFKMFVKVTRKCKEKEQRRATEMFRCLDMDHVGFLDDSEQCQALESLGCLDENGQPPPRSAGERNGADLSTFLNIIERFKMSSRATSREHQGYGFQEVAELRKIFHNSDRNGNGTMSRSQLARVVEQLFPRLAHTIEFRPVLTHLFETADQDHNGSLDFLEFVSMVRQISDHENEKEAIEDLGFSQAEANQFRELFMTTDEAGRHLRA
ncbi:CALML5 [Symbiodinium sp. CCMP2456]|nr:CALML5 [Symbiodinium sp. CCMP2456]